MLDRYKYNEKFYYYNEENCRYLIGTVGTKPLIYFGLNPSSATPSKTDNTFRRLQDIAKFNDFDSIIIVNLYPFLNTETYKKSSIVNKQEKINFQVISDIIQKLSISMKLKVLFCWGDNIKNYENYNYNRRKVCQILENFSKDIYCLKRTKENNPISPVFMKTNTTLQNFEDDFESYLKD